MLLELGLRPEGEPANVRMQAICANHQIESTLISMFESNQHMIRRLLETDNLVVEDDFRGTLGFFEQQS